MVQPSKDRLEDVIEWQFIVSQQGFTGRYGTFNDRYWKQFLPGGIVVSGLHPPRPIEKVLYDRAKKISEA